jgi:hypothetical protein
VKRQKPKLEILRTSCARIVIYRGFAQREPAQKFPSNGTPERVTAPYVVPAPTERVLEESGCFVLQP